eukprot:TRINITY_DN6621_c0_g1_i4.p1 TRINITY_DN6621_c0_g1~~TRINITY_DN6621_c0_g1_i4.p1  ORF type:complete len:179 (+),score=31.42 TRINITY_DN6621_c0_g1_i4:82-618(+)
MLLQKLQPQFWFSGHMHVQFDAQVPHGSGRVTEFLALNKCLDRKPFLETFEIQNQEASREISYDPEWLWILYHALKYHSPTQEQLSMDWSTPTTRCKEYEKFQASFLQLNGGSMKIPYPKSFQGDLTQNFHENPGDPLQTTQNSQTRMLLERISSALGHHTPSAPSTVQKRTCTTDSI